MATVALKSTVITNLDATPKVVANASVAGGAVRSTIGLVTNSAADDVGSVYRYVRVPSNARIKKVTFCSAASGATGQVDIGVYQTAANGGAVVDADFFASALDPGGAAITPTDVTHESGVNTSAKRQQMLWEALGLTADPGRDYDIAATVVEIMANAVAHWVEVDYVL